MSFTVTPWLLRAFVHLTQAISSSATVSGKQARTRYHPVNKILTKFFILLVLKADYLLIYLLISKIYDNVHESMAYDFG